MTILDSIASGGTRIKSPVQRYLDTRKEVAAEDRNRISDLATRQAIGIQQNQEQRADETFKIKKVEAHTKNVLPHVEAVLALPEAQRQSEWDKRYGLVKQSGDQFGVQLPQDGNIWSTEKGQAVFEKYGEKDKGAYKPMVNSLGQPRQGRIVNGRVFDRDMNPQPTWNPAPTEQKIANVEGFGDPNAEKKVNKLIEQEEGVYKITQNLEALKAFVNSPDYVGGTTGDIISAGNSFVQQMRQFTKLGEIKDGNLPKKDVDNPKGETYSALRRAANLGDQKAGLTIELAYNIAKSFDKGGRVTDADFKFARQVIEGSADVASTTAQINDFMLRKQQDYTASNMLASERLGIEPKPYSDERRRKLYNLPPAEATPAKPSIAQELMDSF